MHLLAIEIILRMTPPNYITDFSFLSRQISGRVHGKIPLHNHCKILLFGLRNNTIDNQKGVTESDILFIMIKIWAEIQRNQLTQTFGVTR